MLHFQHSHTKQSHEFLLSHTHQDLLYMLHPLFQINHFLNNHHYFCISKLVKGWGGIDPILNEPFWGWSWMGGGAKKLPFPKICHIYPAMMKPGTVIPYLRKTLKIYESRDTFPLSSAGISIFSQEINKFCYIRKYRYRLRFGT